MVWYEQNPGSNVPQGLKSIKFAKKMEELVSNVLFTTWKSRLPYKTMVFVDFHLSLNCCMTSIIETIEDLVSKNSEQALNNSSYISTRKHHTNTKQLISHAHPKSYHYTYTKPLSYCKYFLSNWCWHQIESKYSSQKARVFDVHIAKSTMVLVLVHISFPFFHRIAIMDDFMYGYGSISYAYNIIPDK